MLWRGIPLLWREWLRRASLAAALLTRLLFRLADFATLSGDVISVTSGWKSEHMVRR